MNQQRAATKPLEKLSIRCACRGELATVAHRNGVTFLRFGQRTLADAETLAREAIRSWRGAERAAFDGIVEMEARDDVGDGTVAIAREYFGAVAIDLAEVEYVALACTCRLAAGPPDLDNTLRGVASKDLLYAWRYRHTRQTVNLDDFTRYEAKPLLDALRFKNTEPLTVQRWSEAVADRLLLEETRQFRRDEETLTADELEGKAQHHLDMRNAIVDAERRGEPDDEAGILEHQRLSEAYLRASRAKERISRL